MTVNLDQLFASYSIGSISRKELMAASGIEWFGTIIVEMANRGLLLPRVDSLKYMNEEQLALFNKIFKVKTS